MRAASGLGLVVLGLAVGVAAVWVHGRWWALALATAATSTTLAALPAGSRRLLFAAGWLTAAVLFLFARPEGDFVVASDAIGYAFIGLGLLVLVFSLATIPPRRRLPGGTGQST